MGADHRGTDGVNEEQSGLWTCSPLDTHILLDSHARGGEASRLARQLGGRLNLPATGH